MALMRENDLILIVHEGNRYLKKLEPKKIFHTKRGTLDYSSLVGLHFGIRVGSYEVFEPTLEDVIMYGLRRETQIVYPKDACYVCLKLSLGEGARVIEAGTGSGALTILFSRTVGSSGMVVSIEKEEKHHRNAQKNIERFGRNDNIELRLGDLAEYDGSGFDAAFIDVREPWFVIEKAWSFLKDSGMLGVIVPTSNQVSETLRAMPQLFGDIEVLELLLRKYKTVADRLRPDDRMVAHTGYLIFGRKVAS